MGKRILSFIVIISLCASTIVGALGLSLRFANAAVSSDELVLREVINSGREHLTGNDLTLFESIISTYIESSFDNTNYLICVCCPTTTFDPDIWHMTIYRGYEGGNLWYMNSSGYFSNYKSGATYAYTDVWQVADVICNVNESFFRVGMPSGNGNWESYINNLPKFSINGSGGLAAPCGQTFTSSSCGVWMNRDIRKLYDDYGVLHSANMILDVPMIEFDIKVFWLGERKYITTVNQQIAYQSDPNKMFYVFEMGDSIEEGHSRVLLSYNSSSNSRGITLLPDGESFVFGLTNVSPQGVYAWDITDIEWDVISYFTLFEYPNTSVSGYATNCPYYINESAPEPGSGGTPDSYTTMWQDFNTYVSNYNTTSIVPDSLSSFLFGSSGVRLYPVDVSFPSGITSMGRQAYTPNVNIFRWKYSGPSDLSVNYEIMDVCIIPESLLGIYGLVYFYDESLQRKLDFIDYYDYKDLLETFDIIIIVPDDDGCLEENTWWQNVLPDDVFDEISNIAVSGSSSQGVLYTSDPLPGNVFAGFAIVTKRCIQRQQLFNFSDGISKFYKLISDYVESEDSWKSSFLQWSASWFSAINTLNGSINALVEAITKLDLGIESKLDRLIENTNEIESNFWYIPLWNFIKQFEPVAEDFVEGLQVYDDNWDNLPLLSPAPTIPLLPTISLGGG